MPSTDFSRIEQSIEPAHADTFPSPRSTARRDESPESEESPRSIIGRVLDPIADEQIVTREERVPPARHVEPSANENVAGSQPQAHAAETAQERGGVRDLRKLGGAAKHSPARKQAVEEERRAIIAAIQECARKLGSAPSLDKMRGMTGITMHRIQRHFGGYNAALGACGLELHDNGRPRTMEELFEDWTDVVRKVGKAPTRAQYDLHGRNSSRPLLHRFHTWSAIPGGMKQYALEHGLESAWKDVMGITEVPMKSPRAVSRIGPIVVGEPGPETAKRTSFGDPFTHLPMVHAPTCENAVLFLFGALANDLGFKVRRMQAAFPDCLAMRRVGENHWEDVKIEMELMSRNFAAHGHDPKGCDLIVCWEHNWPECPLEVVELKKVIGRSGDRNNEDVLSRR